MYTPAMRHMNCMRVAGWLVGALLSVVMAAGLWGCDAHAADKQALQALIDTHAKANEAKDGATIARILSQNTFDHYERNLKLALDGTKAEVYAASASDRMEIARIRMLMNRRQIEKMTGKEYAVYSTSQGWYSFGFDPGEVLGVDLTNFKFAGKDTAYAQPRGGRRNKALPHRYTFIKEGGSGGDWKYDETSSYEHWSQELEEDARRSNREINLFILELVAEDTGKPVNKSLFDRPMR